MPVALDILILVGGLIALLISGDLFVRGAAGLGEAIRLPLTTISIAIIAFGAAAPEFALAVGATRAGQGDLALGLIAGSTIANFLMALALPALVFPMAARVPGLRRHAVALLAGTGLFLAIAYGRGRLGVAEGAILAAGALGWLAHLMIAAASDGKRGGRDPAIDDAPKYSDHGRSAIAPLAALAAGLVGLPFAAGVVIEAARDFAAHADVTVGALGASMLAIGAASPELATIAVAAFRRQSDVAIGAVIASAMANLLGVGAAVGLTGGAAFGARPLALDLPVLGAATVAVAGFVLAGRDIGRFAGAGLVVAYAAFLSAIGALGST